MTGADWKHPHIVVLTSRRWSPFGGGYALGSRGARRHRDRAGDRHQRDDDGAAPRARPDENALIAENAERERSRPAVQPARAERPVRASEPAEPQPRPPAATRTTDRDLVDPGLEDEPQGGKPQDE